jgi:hypothetical protein
MTTPAVSTRFSDAAGGELAAFAEEFSEGVVVSRIVGDQVQIRCQARCQWQAVCMFFRDGARLLAFCAVNGDVE